MVVCLCVVPRNSASLTLHLSQLDDFIIRLNFSVNSVVQVAQLPQRDRASP